MSGRPARLRSYAQLVEASGGDPYVRYGVPARLTGPAYALDGAVALLRTTQTGQLALAAFGPPQPLRRVVRAVLADEEVSRLGLARVSVPQESASVLDGLPVRVGDGDDWEWMWTESAPPASPPTVAALLERLDDERDAAELATFLDRVSPTSHATPGSGAAQLWLGARDSDGVLVACGAMDRKPGGYATLAGIAVDPSRRGAGLGRAVTAELTRHAVALDGACTLGMFSHNTVARRLYLDLGYRIGQRWATRALVA